MQEQVGTRGPGPANSTLLNVDQPWQLRFWCRPTAAAALAPEAGSTDAAQPQDVPGQCGK